MLGDIRRWFGRSVEALTISGLKQLGIAGTSSGSVASTLLQAGQGAPAPPQPQALSPKNGRSRWFSQTHRVLSRLGNTASTASSNETNVGGSCRVPLLSAIRHTDYRKLSRR